MSQNTGNSGKTVNTNFINQNSSIESTNNNYEDITANTGNTNSNSRNTRANTGNTRNTKHTSNTNNTNQESSQEVLNEARVDTLLHDIKVPDLVEGKNDKENDPETSDNNNFLDLIVEGKTNGTQKEYIIPEEDNTVYQKKLQEFTKILENNSSITNEDTIQEGGFVALIPLIPFVAPVVVGVVVGGVFATIIGYAVVRLLIALFNVVIRKIDSIGQSNGKQTAKNEGFLTNLSKPFKSFNFFNMMTGGGLFGQKEKTIKDVVAIAITSAYLHHDQINKIDFNQDMQSLSAQVQPLFNTRLGFQNTISLALGGGKGILTKMKEESRKTALQKMTSLFAKLANVQTGGASNSVVNDFTEDCTNISNSLQVVLTALDQDTETLTTEYKKQLLKQLPNGVLTRMKCTDIYEFYRPELETRMNILQLNMKDLTNNIELEKADNQQKDLLTATTVIIDNIVTIKRIGTNTKGLNCNPGGQFSKQWISYMFRSYGNRIRRTILHFEKLESKFTEYKNKKNVAGGRLRSRQSNDKLQNKKGLGKVCMKTGTKQYNIYVVDGKKCIRSNREYIPLLSMRGKYKRIA
jgi:hypothetical protein